MAASRGITTYLNNHYEGMEPEQLILMLYNGALDRLNKVKEGIRDNDIRKRGENLSSAIAIISELNASLDPNMTDEGTEFLRGLYTAILTELPKVSLSDDLETVQKSEKYIRKLKDIWINTVMKQPKPATGYPSGDRHQARQSISV